MFTSGMVESTKGVLEVVYLSYQTMCTLLTYLYAGKVILNEENCVELLVAGITPPPKAN